MNGKKLKFTEVFEGFDAADPGNIRAVKIAPGEYEFERIPSPRGWQGFWLVVKGTKIGCHENSMSAFIKKEEVTATAPAATTNP